MRGTGARMKRGGRFEITSLATEVAENLADEKELTQVSEALDKLAKIEAPLAAIVDLKFFCGFSFSEIAAMQGVSERTVQRKWEAGAPLSTSRHPRRFVLLRKRNAHIWYRLVAGGYTVSSMRRLLCRKRRVPAGCHPCANKIRLFADQLRILLEEHRTLVEEGFLEKRPPLPPGGAARAGETVDAYTLLSPIGQGGMGSVWLAERSDGRFERQVAVKFLNIALVGRGGEARFKREGEYSGPALRILTLRSLSMPEFLHRASPTSFSKMSTVLISISIAINTRWTLKGDFAYFLTCSRLWPMHIRT